METKQCCKTGTIKGLGRQVFRLLLEIAALGCLYSLSMHVINKLYLLFTGSYKTMTMMQVAAATPVAAPGLTITLPDPVAEILLVCIIGGVLTYAILKYVCSQEWVQEPVQVQECWTEIQWYNPFSWVEAIVCTFVEVLKWVLKQICGYVEVIVTILVIICVIVGIIIVFA
ncbi:MAG: hypothetical protein ABFS18_01780 [Thermodesulfobacteriota bacterium]